MNAFFKFWEIFKVPQKRKLSTKKGLVIDGDLLKPIGLARTLQQARVTRAIRNFHRPHFAEKFICPRHLRTHANLKP